MIPALRVLHLVAIAIWVGAVVFFSFVTAPALFAALPRDMAGRATAAIFPRYYLLGWICGSVALTSALLQVLLQGVAERRLLAGLLLLAAMLGASLYAGRGILPRAAAARLVQADPVRASEHAEAKALFDRLHRQSVMLNGAVLLMGLGALVVAALPARSPAP